MLRFDDADDLIDICLDNVFKAVFARDTPESQGALSSSLLRFAHTTSKNRRSGDFLLCKLRKQPIY